MNTFDLDLIAKMLDDAALTADIGDGIWSAESIREQAALLREYSPQPAPQPVEAEGREATVSVGGLMNVPAERAAQQMRENAKVMDTRQRFLHGIHGGKGDPTDGHIANLLRTGADALDRLAAAPPPEQPAIELENRNPEPNWCRSCGRHRDEPNAVFCPDVVHGRPFAAPTYEQKTVALRVFREPVKFWRDYYSTMCSEETTAHPNVAVGDQLLALIDGAKAGRVEGEEDRG